MKRAFVRLLSLLVIGVGASMVEPAQAQSMPDCTTDWESHCNVPPNYVICTATCTASSTGTLYECTMRPFSCFDE